MSYRHSIGYLLTTNSLIYSCVDRPMVVVATHLVNVNGSNRDFYLQHVPADESPNAKFALHYGEQVRATSSDQYSEPIILSPGETLYAKASAVDSINMTLYIIPYGDWIAGVA